MSLSNFLKINIEHAVQLVDRLRNGHPNPYVEGYIDAVRMVETIMATWERQNSEKKD